jgi:hypothetical protein
MLFSFHGRARRVAVRITRRLAVRMTRRSLASCSMMHLWSLFRGHCITAGSFVCTVQPIVLRGRWRLGRARCAPGRLVENMLNSQADGEAAARLSSWAPAPPPAPARLSIDCDRSIAWPMWPMRARYCDGRSSALSALSAQRCGAAPRSSMLDALSHFVVVVVVCSLQSERGAAARGGVALLVTTALLGVVLVLSRARALYKNRVVLYIS